MLFNYLKIFSEEFKDRRDKEYFSKHVDRAEIEENDYNLSISIYVEIEDRSYWHKSFELRNWRNCQENRWA